MKTTPAEYVVYIFKGTRALARALKYSPSAISRWKRSCEDGGCSGNIPTAAQRKILELARKNKLDITPNDLMFGRKINKQ